MPGIVHTSRNNGSIGIAFDELDDHLLADPRNNDGSPALAGDRLRDANPAGTVFVFLSLPIPMKLDFHAAVFVGIDLRTCRPDNHRRLRASDNRPGRGARRTKNDRVGNARKTVRIRLADTRPCFVRHRLRGRVLDGSDDKCPACLRIRLVLTDFEFPTRGERLAQTGRVDYVVLDFLFLHAGFRQRLTVTRLSVFAREVVLLVLIYARQIHDRVGLGHEIRAGGLEVVIGLSPLSRTKLITVFPAGDVILKGLRAVVARVINEVFRTVLVGARVVSHDQRVFSVFVFEEVENTLLFQQS